MLFSEAFFILLNFFSRLNTSGTLDFKRGAYMYHTKISTAIKYLKVVTFVIISYTFFNYWKKLLQFSEAVKNCVRLAYIRRHIFDFQAFHNPQEIQKPSHLRVYRGAALVQSTQRCDGYLCLMPQSDPIS